MVTEYANEVDVALALRAADQRTQGAFSVVTIEWTTSYDVPFLPVFRRTRNAKLLIEANGDAWDVTGKPRRVHAFVPVCAPIHADRDRLESLAITVATVRGEWSVTVLPGVGGYTASDDPQPEPELCDVVTWTTGSPLDGSDLGEGLGDF